MFCPNFKLRHDQRRKSIATNRATIGKKKKKKKKSKLKYTKILVLRIYQLKINGMYTAILGFFMSPGIEVNILLLIIHKTFRIRIVSIFPNALS